FIYQQTGALPSAANDVLIDLVNPTGWTTLQAAISVGSIDPIILDLDNNGYSFSSLTDGAQFDINADGAKDQVAWNTSNDGILAVDLNDNGTIDDGTEIFTPSF